MPISVNEFKQLYLENEKTFSEYIASNALRVPVKVRGDGSVIINKSDTFATYVAFKNKKATIENVHSSLIVSPLKFKKIDRFSDKSVEDVSNSFFNSLLSSNMQFTLRYGKELFLRDKQLFEEKLLFFVLINIGNRVMLEHAVNLLFNNKNIEDADLFMALGAISLSNNNTSLYETAFINSKTIKSNDVISSLENKYKLHSQYLQYFFDTFGINETLASAYKLLLEIEHVVLHTS